MVWWFAYSLSAFTNRCAALYSSSDSVLSLNSASSPSGEGVLGTTDVVAVTEALVGAVNYNSQRKWGSTADQKNCGHPYTELCGGTLKVGVWFLRIFVSNLDIPEVIDKQSRHFLAKQSHTLPSTFHHRAPCMVTTIVLVSGGSQGHEMMQSKWRNNLIGRSEEKTGGFVALCQGPHPNLETKWIPWEHREN